MCKKRKYQYYDIRVINNINNSVESISLLNKEEVDKSNYKQMLDVYRIIKEQYKNDNVTIDFYGVDDKSTMKILYEKKFTFSDNGDNEDNGTETTIDLCKQLNDLCGKISNINENLSNSESICDKKQNMLLHRLENLKKKNIYELSNDEKNIIIQIALDIQTVRIRRREIKNERKIYQGFTHKNLFHDLLEINNRIYTSCVTRNNQINYISQQCKKKLNNVRSMEHREIPYKSFKERINIMRQMQKKFDQVRYDEDKKIVFCYNNCMA
mgnify:CR=1 FL=1